MVGGIEASLRRLSHYDYWQDRLRPSILLDCQADILVYGMGERTITTIAQAIDAGMPVCNLTNIRQTVIRVRSTDIPAADEHNIILNSWEQCLHDRRCQSLNFKHIEQQSNRRNGGATLWQQYGNNGVKANPMYPAMDIGEIDASFDLPYTYAPPSLPRQTYPGLRNDSTFGQYAPRMLRRLRLLYHLGTPRQIYSLAFGRIHSTRSQGRHPNAGFQGIYK